MDPGQSPDWDCGAKHFTMPQNELKSHVFPFKLQNKIVIVLSNLILDHLSFTVVAN